MIIRSANTLRELRLGVQCHWPARAWGGQVEEQRISEFLGKEGVLGLVFGRMLSWFPCRLPSEKDALDVKRASLLIEHGFDRHADTLGLKRGEASALAEEVFRDKEAHDERTLKGGRMSEEKFKAKVAEFEKRGESFKPKINCPRRTGIQAITENVQDLNLGTNPTTTIAPSKPLSAVIFEKNQNQNQGAAFAWFQARKTKRTWRQQLSLKSLELENMSLNLRVILLATDSTKLQSLTILHCWNGARLWPILNQKFGLRLSGLSSHMAASSTRMPPLSGVAGTRRSSHPFRLKHVRTNSISPDLITFLAEALPANCLESLYLYHGLHSDSDAGATIESILHGPVWRHRESLQRLLLDPTSNGVKEQNWARWALNRERVWYLVQCGMQQLRQLSICLLPVAEVRKISLTLTRLY